MKILIINRPVDNYVKGTGIAAVMFWLKKRLVDNDFKVIDCKKVWKIPTFHSIWSIIFYDIINPVLIALKYRNTKLDHVFFLDVSQCVSIFLIKRILKGTKITTLVHAYPEEKGLYLDYARCLTKIAIKHSDKIISTADENKKRLLKKYSWCTPDKIVVLPLGLTIYPNQKKKDLKLPIKKKVVTLGYLGASLYRKRLERLNDLMQHANKNNLPLTIITAGPIKPAFIDLFTSNISDIVNFYHFGLISEEEKVSFFSLIDAFIFPTEREGYGLPILESFYYKKPCIVFNKAKIPEILKSHCLLLNKDLNNFNNFYNNIKNNDNNLKSTTEHNYNYSLSFDWQCYIDYFRK